MLHVQLQRTPLHEAADNGHEAVTRALVEAEADVRAKDSTVNVHLWDLSSWGWWLRQRGGVLLHVQGETPLDRATSRGHAGVMKLLQKAPGTRGNGELYESCCISLCVCVCTERERERERLSCHIDSFVIVYSCFS